MVRAQKQNLLNAKTMKITMLHTMIQSNPNNVDLPISLAKVENKVDQLQFDMNEDIDVQMTEQEKNKYRLELHAYADRVNKLKTHQEQVYALILGQC